MNANPIGLVEVLVLLIGFVLVVLTSDWSPLKKDFRFRLGFLGLAVAYFTILPGLAYAKSDGTFLAGSNKLGLFFCWAFGLWFSLLLLRHSRLVAKGFGLASLVVFSLLLTSVVTAEVGLVLDD